MVCFISTEPQAVLRLWWIVRMHGEYGWLINSLCALFRSPFIAEEADTHVVLQCKYASRLSSGKGVIVVHHLTLMYWSSYWCTVISFHPAWLFDAGIGNNRRVVDVTNLSHTIGSTMCQALPFYHALTSCDFTSAFVCRDKVKPLQLLENDQQFMCLFTLLVIFLVL